MPNNKKKSRDRSSSFFYSINFSRNKTSLRCINIFHLSLLAATTVTHIMHIIMYALTLNIVILHSTLENVFYVRFVTPSVIQISYTIVYTSHSLYKACRP